jgi:hypothetical protein
MQMNAALLTRVLCVLGVVLHIYQVSLASADAKPWVLFGLLIFSCLTYVIAWFLSRYHSRYMLGLGIALACLVADIVMHYAVFIAPKGSTAALGLLALPFWNLLVTAPAGAGIGWLVARWLKLRG